MKREGI